ncbi:MAG: cytochrome b/b6 domain-containing protein [Sulfurimonas sp.]|nr:cytochrome b/b6 domain-containing protein [Sulfurimonas sp.]
MTKIYVWSLFTRLFHLLLVLAVAVAFLLADFESLLTLHVAVGFTIGLLFVYRIIWGFMDVRYSQFKDFHFNLVALKEYMFGIFGTKKKYIGHNPASSYAIVAMIVLGLGSVFSGAVVYGTQEGMGIFSFLNFSFFKKMDFFKDVHEFFSNAFMAVIFVHIAGVILDKVLHKSKAAESMMDGYKDGDAESLKLTLFQKLFGVLWIASSLFLFIYILSNPSSVLVADANTVVDYKKEHPQFYKECKSCHTLYPPYLLSKQSWVKMMDNLENHFGDDASLDEKDKKSIRDYLVENAAENSTKESAFNILKSIKNTEAIAITKTPYWQKRHEDIDKNIFASKEISVKSNCKACHKNIEQGLLNDKDIKIPKISKG